MGCIDIARLGPEKVMLGEPCFYEYLPFFSSFLVASLRLSSAFFFCPLLSIEDGITGNLRISETSLLVGTNAVKKKLETAM